VPRPRVTPHIPLSPFSPRRQGEKGVVRAGLRSLSCRERARVRGVRTAKDAKGRERREKIVARAQPARG